MHKCDAAFERKRALTSVLCTAVMIPAVVALFVTGPQWPLFVYTLGFMAGYIVERISLCRRIVGLIQQVESASPPMVQSL